MESNVALAFLGFFFAYNKASLEHYSVLNTTICNFKMVSQPTIFNIYIYIYMQISIIVQE